MKNYLSKISIILLAALALGVTSCGPSFPNPSDSSEPSDSEVTDTESSESEDTSSSTPSEDEEPVVTEYNSPSDNAKEVTIKTLVNKGSNSDYKTLYRITGVVQHPYNYNYGNFDLVDETGYITVWGLSKNKSTLTYSNSKYSYSNDKTFRSMNIKAGDTITMEGIYTPYVQGGYIKPEIVGYTITKVDGNVDPILGANYTSEEVYVGSYYNDVEGLEGNNLLKGLHNLMMDTHDTYVSYDSLKTTFKSSDPGTNSSQVRCFYSGQSTSSFNREHVWAQSLSGTTSNSSTNLYGSSYGGSDIHHLRPAIGTYNSLRSNAAFGYVYGPKTGMGTIPHVSGEKNYLTGAVIEPVDEIKGDVARIVMYMYMHYSSSICNDGSKYSFLGTMNVYYIMGPNMASDCFKLLREWNALDPVDDYERNRNEVAFSKQGNRNPFIDHPSYADMIWG